MEWPNHTAADSTIAIVPCHPSALDGDYLSSLPVTRYREKRAEGFFHKNFPKAL
ncbi:hypothetical protein HMPREF0281_01168 [Corynebacterium ammoniagenes DSM 20306]|uniref:Uncharacterized protein n=1 Tax=Corynebacterium ammoniagenes DSM 20306 TaxID=649754 RepID=A0ABN0AF31_CORAM|nr:hypothetical protein HMPREF0281_01168 [Corynebacterium ammoniagenes DSM 20306]